MAGHHYQDITGWRETVRDALEAEGIRCYSPLRGKQDVLDTGAPIPATGAEGTHSFASPDFILGRDFNDCTNADLVIANFLGCNKPSLGTAMEIAWCYQNHIPVVLIGEADNINCKHPMILSACKFRTESLDEGIEMAISILCPGI
jgi:nucleoside 2-deoxyribosyltransferase